MRRIRIDRFLVAIVCAAVVASILPARGAAVPVVDWSARVLIGLLFFLYGARLERREALTGLRHWRLHGIILTFTYVVFPLAGLGLSVLSPAVIGHDLYLGILYICLVPSTVQSSINFTSIARGNVAGAIVSASVSNLLGVLLTPVLVLTLMGTTGGLKVDPSSVLDIVAQILLPFLAGQFSRRWTAGLVRRYHTRLRLVDQGSIVVVVYSAFSAGIRQDIWTRVSLRDLVTLVGICLVLLATMLWLTWFVAGRFGFDRADRIAIQFCGTKKSLATGLPMATVLFAGGPTGLLVLPLMVFHQAQLMACGALAGHYARHGDTAPQERAAR